MNGSIKSSDKFWLLPHICGNSHLTEVCHFQHEINQLFDTLNIFISRFSPSYSQLT